MGDGAAANAADFTDGQPLDPISEEDDESHGAAPRTPCTRKRGGGALYHQLPNEEEELETEADPLLILLHKHQEAGDVSSRRRKLRGGGTLPQTSPVEVAPDKKDSSDSGVRPGDSSSDQERALLSEAEDAARKLDATARMSICSEAASEVSLMSSTPDGAGVLDMRLTSDTGGVCNLNRGLAATAAIAAIINNNNPGDGSNTNANNSRQRSAASVTVDPSPVIIITPGSTGTTAAATIHNQNLRTINMGDERESIL